MKQILLIDDDPMQLHIRELLLRDAGFLVSIATTAESALATLRVMGESVGLVITDHILPGALGSHIVRQLREFLPELPVIVLSGLTDAEDEYEGLTITFREKPLPPGELIRLVTAAIGPPTKS